VLTPAIVIPTYNRPATLSRLLSALLRAAYPGGEITLVISIDRGEAHHHPEVISVAGSFDWPYGEKRLLLQDERLGLVKHNHACSALSKEFGAIILLEDDLYVSPPYYLFASQSLEAYKETDQVAGVSLYSLWFNGYTHQPFVPLPDESDAFFLQIPYHQGQAFTGQQWEQFENWLAVEVRQVAPQDVIHPMFAAFDPEDWFPLRTKYLADNDLFYVYPRQSLSTCFGDTGTHFTRRSTFLQAPLQRFQDEYRLKPYEVSSAVYDSFFEILPSRLSRISGELVGIAYDVDLYATKSRRHLRAPYTLTTRGCRSPLMQFGKELWPLEANVIDGVRGKGISLCRVEDLCWGWLDELVVRKRNHDFFTRRRKPGKKKSLLYWLVEVAERAGLVKY
jgi:hypothetical protein